MLRLMWYGMKISKSVVWFAGPRLDESSSPLMTNDDWNYHPKSITTMLLLPIIVKSGKALFSNVSLVFP